MELEWDFGVPNNSDPLFWVKELWRPDPMEPGLVAHKMVRPDLPGQFHTHPYDAIRLVLYGGYVEEMEDGRLIEWRPGRVGWVTPDYCHRIHSLLNGRVSYSLWWHGPRMHEVQLRGPGWSVDDRPFRTLEPRP